MHFDSHDIDGGAVCGDALRPISDQEWVCTSRAAHDGDHIALDGTRW